VVTESSSDVKVPAATFVGRRYSYVPGSHEVAERIFHCLPDREDHRRVGNVSNLDVNRVDDEHRSWRCKCGTIRSSSRFLAEGQYGGKERSAFRRQKSDRQIARQSSWPWSLTYLFRPIATRLAEVRTYMTPSDNAGVAINSSPIEYGRSIWGASTWARTTSRPSNGDRPVCRSRRTHTRPASQTTRRRCDRRWRESNWHRST
jgi:hypothetical protein